MIHHTKRPPVWEVFLISCVFAHFIGLFEVGSQLEALTGGSGTYHHALVVPVKPVNDYVFIEADRLVAAVGVAARNKDGGCVLALEAARNIEGVHTVDDSLGLSCDLPEIDGRCQNDHVGLLDLVIEGDHIVLLAAGAVFEALGTMDAAVYLLAGHTEFYNFVSCLLSAFHKSVAELVGVLAYAGAAVDNKDLFCHGFDLRIINVYGFIVSAK